MRGISPHHTPPSRRGPTLAAHWTAVTQWSHRASKHNTLASPKLEPWWNWMAHNWELVCIDMSSKKAHSSDSLNISLLVNIWKTWLSINKNTLIQTTSPTHIKRQQFNCFIRWFLPELDMDSNNTVIKPLWKRHEVLWWLLWSAGRPQKLNQWNWIWLCSSSPSFFLLLSLTW